MNDELVLLLHRLSDWDQRRAIEEAMGWSLIPHPLPHSDLLPPPSLHSSNRHFEMTRSTHRICRLKVFRPHGGEQPMYDITMSRLHPRWIRMRANRWIEANPNGTWCHYLRVSVSCLHTGVVMETHLDPKFILETMAYIRHPVVSHTPVTLWRGTREGEWKFNHGAFL